MPQGVSATTDLSSYFPGVSALCKDIIPEQQFIGLLLLHLDDVLNHLVVESYRRATRNFQ
jgi:hypothetical protein